VQEPLACEVSDPVGDCARAAIRRPPLSETELVVLNANLLLDDLARIGKQKV
jgi:hypothetical protein